MISCLYPPDGRSSLANLDRIVKVVRFFQLKCLVATDVALDATLVKIINVPCRMETALGGLDGAATAIPLRSVMTGHLLDILAFYLGNSAKPHFK